MAKAGVRICAQVMRGLTETSGAGFKPAPDTFTAYLTAFAAYAFPASFNPRSTFSGLRGNLVIRTPVAL